MAIIGPNQYSLSERHLKIEYSTTGIQGKPSLSYHDSHQTLTFNGEQIRVEDTEIGQLVTVTIKPGVDTGSTTFSVLIPTIVLATAGTQQDFHTEGITTVHKTSLVQPSTGVRETYAVHNLKGVARQVEFLAARPGGAGANA